ncbi:MULTISPECIES: TetR/AcrR family transcriptional regulator [Mycobacterium]|uniref:TetR family transcriptional regulator n=1 Tax=Mycobacterium kiyosense TaxID=2871094 RepID=A0A9P3Q4J1_9MYCO|nr:MULTISPECIES: TetR/AcrR family transcriptional regulator [Mycobacterium]BDB43086.1 TetR family transcriptional regulator [Mycobacterium kiyosense]BDE13705.1 TetR family transcriptional regulator [Mycobacterium sp. 20KCMC460]GLB84468.1 TetR family transcriptional regulator [Mycobacterium kiyosense]GLB89051.1 TetR family transcriptional regulator [Mycobacterium kiyosense]GLB94345.1 TetR family transcriptional regulator [Mycobacterium kiyosense]
MRSHGWSGDTPGSDEEAISRILDAAERLLVERGPALRIADVARTLGVTRQTVYRYFPNAEQLILTTSMRSGDGFLEQLAARVRGVTEPVDAVVEGMAFAVEQLADDPRINFILTNRPGGKVTTAIASDTALTFSRSMLHRFDVDWEAHGFDEAALDELSEFTIRLLYSFLTERDIRSPDELRRFLARWVGPAIRYPRLAGALDPIAKTAVPTARSRRRTAS